MVAPLASSDSSASHGGTTELGSVLPIRDVNMDYRQSQNTGPYLASKLHKAEGHLDAGLDQLSVVEQHISMN